MTRAGASWRCASATPQTSAPISARSARRFPSLSFSRCLPGMYDIRHIDIGVRCAFTNTVPTAPYRGAGRPEANYVLERVVEEAARVTGIDPAKLRRRNLIPASAMPYKTAVGTTFDSGDFAPILAKALALAGYAGVKARKREAARRGKLRGIGISCMLEHAGGTPTEGALLAFPGDGTVTVGLNVQSTGQGHASIFPAWRAERLGLPRSMVTHRHGDSALEIAGYASVGSRSAMTAGASLVKCDRRDARERQAHRRAAAVRPPTPTSPTPPAASCGRDRPPHRAHRAAQRAAELSDTARSRRLSIPTSPRIAPLTFPNGVHIAEVEIDPETGRMEVIAYSAVDDCGNVLDGMILRGPAARRGRARARPGADRSRGLRRWRPARYRLVHGLCHAARRRYAADPRPSYPACRRPPIRSASRASVKPAPRLRSPR